ncbi:hypothetical protein IAT38_001487 [Cryptococcus sp. DSM 104549]
MTSRLKHKLELEQVNLKSNYLNESFVQIGTPLPALADNKKDKLEYVPEWNQEVRDEQGRRRFHGAFTGGFSAGYYNSVGSKEGWTPSTFKSSRSNRANKTQRAEDFMDEEDLQNMRDDRKLENTDTFRSDQFAGTREALVEKSLPSSLESLIAPTQSSIGQKLLQKLGWRPGQGIGPRVTLRKLRLQESKLGRTRLADGGDEDMDDAEAGKHTFAPRDTKLLVYEAKDDKEGLGYEKGKGMGRLQGMRGPAAGPSRLDDDDDPYGAGPSTSSLAFAFDHGDEADDDVIVMGGASQRPGLGSGMPGSRGGQSSSAGSDDRWHDGRPVLAGFMLDPDGVPADKWFAMPEIPLDWRPRPARVWGTTRKWDEMPGHKPEEKEVIRGAPGRPLTFEQRGSALGEEQRISQAKSVFEYMSEKDRERLASLQAGAPPMPPSLALSLAPEPEQDYRPPATEVEIPPLSPRTASAALQGFMPYGDNTAKQERYRSYLLSQTYNTKQPNPTLLPSASLDAINKELEAFASSARIFKPMPFAMANRFTSGSNSVVTAENKAIKPGLHIFDAEKAKEEIAKAKVPDPEVQKDLTPREQAARNGMHGKMTRVVMPFYPVKLLCKRFGVKDPHPEGEPAKAGGGEASGSGSGVGGSSAVESANWQSKFIYKGDAEPEKPASPAAGSSLVGVLPPSEERAPKSIAEVGMAEDINQGRDTLTYTKPNIDIFKAIFASDDEDDEDEEDEPVKAVMAKPTAAQEEFKDPFPPKRSEEDEKPVDLTTFKPVFARRRDEEQSADGKKEKERKKEKKKKRKGVLSFDIGEDGDEEEDKEREDKKRRKKDREKEKEKERSKGKSERLEKKKEPQMEDDLSMWVEKPAVDPRTAGRKGAADLW